MTNWKVTKSEIFHIVSDGMEIASTDDERYANLIMKYIRECESKRFKEVE